MFTSLLVDACTRIRNAQRAQHSSVVVYYSKLILSALEVLKDEGYITGYESFDEKKGVKRVNVALKYHFGRPVINHLKTISKPGCRVYSNIRHLPKKCGGLGVVVLSTPKGVMADHMARSENIGGEVLFEVF